jgi:pyridoxal phosphate enzyme (YggS family)
MSSIKQNLEIVQEKISQAAIKSGRKPEDITLVAVSKTVGAEQIQEAVSLGIKNIGENRIQEAKTKYDLIRNEITWHMIGHLQTNKVKQAIEIFNLIHSIDRVSLAQELEKRAANSNKNIDILIQINISEEVSKFGLKKNETLKFIEQICNFSHLNIKGLMTMAPFVDNPEEVRPCFTSLRKLAEDIKKRTYPRIEMKYLSMGMSQDYEAAIEEGANIVRVGTAIFGERK